MTRVFLAGAGYIAREHAAAATDPSIVADGVELHVADPDPAALASFAAAFPAAVAHADARSMFAVRRDETDVAVIATPPASHHELVRDALDAGLHTLCEKPLALTAGEAADLARRADAAGRILGSCDDRFRDLATTQEVRRLVAAGTLGEIYHATFVNTLRRARTGFDQLTQSAWFRDPRIAGGGVMMDWGPYDIAVLDEILDPVRVEVRHAWASGPITGGPFGDQSALSEQHVGAVFDVHTRAGAVVPVSYERAAATHGAERGLVQVEGDHAAVSWDWLDWLGDEVRLTRDQDGTPSTVVSALPAPAIGFHARPLARMVAAVRAGADPRPITHRSLFTFAWLRAVLDCAARRAPVTVELDALAGSVVS